MSTPSPSDNTAPQVMGSSDAPALKPRRALFAASLFLFALWMAILIYWSIDLHR